MAKIALQGFTEFTYVGNGFEVDVDINLGTGAVQQVYTSKRNLALIRRRPELRTIRWGRGANSMFAYATNPGAAFAIIREVLVCADENAP